MKQENEKQYVLEMSKVMTMLSKEFADLQKNKTNLTSEEFKKQDKLLADKIKKLTTEIKLKYNKN